MIRRVAFYGYLGSGNLGNDASFETVLHWWRAHHPEVELHCITIAPEAVRARYDVSAEPLAWRPRRPSPHRAGRIAERVAGRVADLLRTYRFAGSADAMIVPGMGVLESTLGTKAWGLPMWLFAVSLACRLRRRPFVLLDVGADLADSRVTRQLNSATVGLAAHVSYRDAESAAAMATLTDRQPDAIAPDLAFAHPAAQVVPTEPGRLVIGVMAYYGQSDDAVAGAALHDRYLEALAEAIVRLLPDGLQVVLVGGDTADDAVAVAVRQRCRQIEPELPDDAVLIRRCCTFDELTEEMGRAELVVASRFHNLIAALRTARPTVSVGYAPKSRHLMHTMNLGDYCLDLVDMDADRLVALVRRARDCRPELSTIIGAAAARSAEQVGSLLADVGRSVFDLPIVAPVSIPEDAR